MIIKHAVSGAIIDTDDETGKKLLEVSGWVVDEPVKKPAPKPRPEVTRKSEK